MSLDTIQEFKTDGVGIRCRRQYEKKKKPSAPLNIALSLSRSLSNTHTFLSAVSSSFLQTALSPRYYPLPRCFSSSVFKTRSQTHGLINKSRTSPSSPVSSLFGL